MKVKIYGEKKSRGGMQMTDNRALRRLLRQHYGKRRPSADEILQVMEKYDLRTKPKRGRKKK